MFIIFILIRDNNNLFFQIYIYISYMFTTSVNFSNYLCTLDYYLLYGIMGGRSKRAFYNMYLYIAIAVIVGLYACVRLCIRTYDAQQSIFVNSAELSDKKCNKLLLIIDRIFRVSTDRPSAGIFSTYRKIHEKHRELYSWHVSTIISSFIASL